MLDGSRKAWTFARRGLHADRSFLDSISNNPKRRRWLVRELAVPSLRLGFLLRLAANGGGLGKIARNALMAWHGSDCTPGAKFAGAVYFPHPVGIVIGSGVEVGNRVWIYQHVTVGAGSTGLYPRIGDEVRILPGALIAGDLAIGNGAVIGAYSRVRTQVAPGSVIRADWSTTEGNGVAIP